MVKLADALDSKSCGVKSVSVRVRPPAPTSKNSPLQGLFFICSHIAHRRRADVGANEKEAVRSTAVFASAEQGHRAPRDTTGIRPYPALRRSHIAHRRRADAGANEKEAVRSTAVFASAERGHRALRDTTGIRPLFTQRFRPSAERGHRALRDTTGIRPYPAMPDRNNTNQVQRRRFPPEPRHSPC